MQFEKMVRGKGYLLILLKIFIKLIFIYLFLETIRALFGRWAYPHTKYYNKIVQTSQGGLRR